MKKTFIIKPSMEVWQEFARYVESIHVSGKSVTIDVEEGERKKRSLSANALQAVWITEIAEWQGHTEKYVRNYVKAELALPILLEDEESETVERIAWTLDKINYHLMTPAQKINVMDMFQVTSLMTTKQHNRLRDQMQKHYSDAGLELVVR